MSTILDRPDLLLPNLLKLADERDRAKNAHDSFDERINRPMAGVIYQLLEKHYPGNYWHVEVELEHAKIEIFAKHLDVNSMYVNPDDIINDPEMKAVIRAGGELLERYNLARGKADQSAIADTVERLPDPILRKDVEMEG